MIVRMWRGYTRRQGVEDYLSYLRETGVAEYTATRGNLGCEVLCRQHGDRAEFLLISRWESLEGIRSFAGEDVERAVFYPEDDRFLIDRELTVSHFEVLDRVSVPTSPARPPAS